MHTILHKTSRLFLPVLLLLTIASCSYPRYNRYNNNGAYNRQRQYGYGSSRPGWHDRDRDYNRNRGRDWDRDREHGRDRDRW